MHERNEPVTEHQGHGSATPNLDANRSSSRNIDTLGGGAAGMSFALYPHTMSVRIVSRWATWRIWLRA